MSMRLSSAQRTALCDALVDAIDSGGGTAVLQIWSGSRPSAVTDAPAGTKLIEFDLPNPCFGGASTGVATANSITGVAADATGTAAFARVVNRGGTALWDDNDLGTGANAIQLSTTSITSGADCDVTSWTVTMPAE